MYLIVFVYHFITAVTVKVLEVGLVKFLFYLHEI